jgi:N,N-dimethylformamidase
MVGVTWTCTGWETGAPYRRNAASFDPRVAHLFAGIGDDELIGEKGAFLGAAASMEVDLAHPLLGTPAHALVVATAAMPAAYDKCALFPILGLVGKEDDKSRLRRGDIVYFEARGGGAVFSTGSMGWIGALSHDGDRNAASRLTANALRSFIEGRR